MRTKHPNDYGMQIHVVWYCISVSAKRIIDLVSLCNENCGRKIYQYVLCLPRLMQNAVGQNNLNSLYEVLHTELSDIQSFCFSAVDDAVREVVVPFVQRD